MRSPRCLLSLCSILSLALPSIAVAQDNDSDGVADHQDAFPCDPASSAIGYVPARGASALAVFEDQWPEFSDLDFNDVVIAYHYAFRMNAAGQVVSIIASYDPIALGGRYDNGLGLQLPVARGSVASISRFVEGASFPEPLTLSTVDGQATVQLAVNLRDELFNSTVGQINSQGDLPRAQGRRVVLEVHFTSPQSVDFAAAPFDLFIFRTETPSHEIHFPQYGGTQNMNANLFGSMNDGSTPGRRYVDTDGLPYAITLPDGALYPMEGTPITTLFPNITAWAASNGVRHRDFYSNGVVLAAAYADAQGRPQLTPRAPDTFPADRDCTLTSCTDGIQNGDETGVDCGGSCAIPETCNGVDDDCNGQVDDNIGTRSCGTGACRVTIDRCIDGGNSTCTPGQPSPEVCNGIDDDCDGRVDEGLGNLTCGTGACRVTVPACVGGSANTCTPGAPSGEICDGLDNDCNGTIDNGASASCPVAYNAVQACVSGSCAMSSCLAGYGDCNSRANDGCEAPFDSDPLNCGACGNRCPTGVCQGGQCQCAAPNCNNACGVVSDGCGGTVDCGPCAAPGLDVSQYYSCAIHASGSVRCWGRNNRGQLGDGAQRDRYGVTTVQGLPGGATGVTTGAQHACALLGDGTVWCWGYNTYGQLGDNTRTQRATPVQVQGLTQVQSVAAGLYHTCALRTDGSVWCWGYDGYGQMGTGGTTSRRLVPVQSPSLSNVAEIDAGRYHTCARLNDGTVWCMGYNNYGQLGDNSSGNRYAPVQVQNLTIATGLGLAKNGDFSCATVSDGTVRCWGRNNYGQLGDNTTSTRRTPIQVSGLTNVAQVDAGEYHTCARHSDGTVSCWGYNGAGTLGDGTTTTRRLPVAVAGLTNVAVVSAGYRHSCALRGDGTVACWGNNGYGELGDETNLRRTAPAAVAHLPCPAGTWNACTGCTPTTCQLANVASGNTPDACGGTLYCGHANGQRFDAGENFSCAIRPTGEVECWGRNSNGQLGTGDTQDYYQPTLNGVTDALSVATGRNHACAARNDGTVWCWGYNNYGQLGDDSTTRRLAPVQVPGITNAVQVTAAEYHTCALLADETALCWGRNDNGRLGDGTTTDRRTPTPVVDLDRAVKIVAGANHTCALRSHGLVQCWGSNGSGALGNGTAAHHYPQNVPSNAVADAVDVAVSKDQHTSCAVLSDGTVRCWGYNNQGQVGDGTTTSRNEPTAVTGITTATRVSVGFRHSCAVLANGESVCWGYNNQGQVGDGTTTRAATPTAVTGITNAREIIAGWDHTCVRHADDAISCWGDGVYGALGNQSQVDSRTPVSVYAHPCQPSSCVTEGAAQGRLADHCGGHLSCGRPAEAVAAGDYFNCARRSDGTVLCWGRNNRGQLGDGTTFDPYHPVRVQGLDGVLEVGVGQSHACALRNDGTVWCWGYNTYGQLGDNTRTQRTTPVQVQNLTGVTQISVGLYHSCARRADDTAWCWGYDGYGQMGTGSTASRRLVPVQVTGILGYRAVTQVSAGLYHTCLLTSGGRVACTGRNNQGQLGNGNNSDQHTPVEVLELADVVAVEAGPRSDHTCAVRADGTAWCWGNNNYGQLGDNTTSRRYTPVPVTGLTSVERVSVGNIHSCARRTDGTAWCWGYNGTGLLGDGSTSTRRVPVQVGGLTDVADIAAGYRHTCALLGDGSARCWGSNSYGELGSETNLTAYTPATVQHFPCPAGTSSACNQTCTPTTCSAAGATSGTIADGCGGTLYCGVAAPPTIESGTNFSCGLRSDGTVECWGRNNYGQLGAGTTRDRYHPQPVSGVANAVAVSTGENHACALIGDGTVRCWGYNNYGQLGDGTTTQRTSPVAPNVNGAIGVSVGRYHSCAVLGDGRATCWGYNGNGQIGDATTTNRATPVSVLGLAGAIQIEAGDHHTCALLANGLVECWGDNGRGQLGNGTAASYQPRFVAGLRGAVEISTSARADSTCAVLSNGQVWCWGYNNQGQLGDGTTSQRTTPVQAVGLASAVSVDVGYRHACAVLADTTVQCWGYNNYGQVGDGTTTRRTTPQAVTSVSGAVAVSAGQDHTCAQLSDGSAQCWGYNAYGQLGNQSSQSSQVAVDTYAFPCTPTTCEAQGVYAGAAANQCGVNLSCGGPLSQLESGDYSNCAIHSDGTVWCWGYNTNGQLGDGSTRNRFYPVQVVGLTGATQIVRGYAHSCALRTDGTVWCWGYNSNGQLGDNTRTRRTTPVQVQNLTNVVEIASGYQHTCARRDDNTLWCWGYNGYGNLGDGSTSRRLTPVQVTDLDRYAGISGVTAGTYHTCALLQSGGAVCWGRNNYGQLGNGTTGDQYRPVEVQGLTSAVTVRSGYRADYTCAILGDGTARCWGYNGYGQLGDNTSSTRYAPVTVSGLAGVADLDMGNIHTCASLTDGTVWCWGYGGTGLLGQGNTANYRTPRQVPGVVGVRGVTAGYRHTCALMNDGTAQCWGSNTYGELGDETNLTRSAPGAVAHLPCEDSSRNTCTACVPTTCVAQGASGGAIADGCGGNLYCGSATPPSVSGGDDFTCATRPDATVECWGDNAYGQLGLGSTQDRYEPTTLPGLANVVSVASGFRHACAVHADGTVSCWGYNNYGQLGDGTTTQRTSPVAVSGVTDAIAISAGYYHTCAIRADRTAVCWGYNAYGQIGDDTTTNRATAASVLDLTGAVEIVSGAYHSCALRENGNVVCWGRNNQGQLGMGTSDRRYIHHVPVVRNVVDISSSPTADHTCALDASGQVFCWGDNSQGQIGDASTTDRNTPTLVAGLTGATQVSVGDRHTCAARTDGTVWCWGYNANRQLANGSTSRSTSPQQVTGVSGATELVAGDDHTCARVAGGALTCWGHNAHGQLGNQSNQTPTSPVAVHAHPCRPTTCAASLQSNGLTTDACGGQLHCGRVQNVASAGDYFTCSAHADGTVWCWGYNNYGQLGDDTTRNRFAPVQVQGVSNATGVVNGYAHACALIADGTVRCWGRNNNGQLGDGTRTTRRTAVTVPGLFGVTEITAGYQHTCARLTDGTARCWGYNGYGNLGDGSTSRRLSPVTVNNVGAYPEITGITGGLYHTCALLSSGGVICWGYNRYGQLGNGTTSNSSAPVEVQGIDDAIAVYSGYRAEYTCAVLADGTARCWGYNGYGQLGDNSTSTRYTPVASVGLANVAEIAMGNIHTCATLQNGDVYCWGYGGTGTLGQGNTTNLRVPTRVAGVTGAVGVVAGYRHSCAQLGTGDVQCWGSNTYGELGDESNVVRSTPVSVAHLPCQDGSRNTCNSTCTPTSCVAQSQASGSIGDGCGGNLYCGEARSDQLAAGYRFTCAARSDGTVDCWGYNNRGQLGQGNTQARYVPTRVPGLSGVTSLAAGYAHACTSHTDGTVQCWGYNNYGQLGLGTTTQQTSPTPVPGITDAVRVVAGQNHTCALRADRSVICWGYNAYGQLGDATSTNRSAPVATLDLGGVVDLTAGLDFTCALLEDGTGACWGRNNRGQLGNGSASYTYPQPVSGLRGAVDIVSGMDAQHACAVHADGTMSCWGYNHQGQLGDNTTTHRPTPVLVSGLTGAVTGHAGNRHTCAALAGGQVMCWGDNQYGQLGDGSTTDRRTPVVAAGAAGAVETIAGQYHTCAMDAAGAVACWGTNYSGELGDETTTPSSSPRTVFAFPCQPTTCSAAGVNAGTIPDQCGGTLHCGGSQPSVTDGGDYFSCAVGADGRVFCQGRNNAGQLGDGSTADRWTSAPVQNLTNVTQVSAGYQHACALRADTSVWCWGYNSNGQLGDGSRTNRAFPVQVSGLSNVLEISAGYQHTCARAADGSAYCWGYNGYGNLGDGTTSRRLTPVRVSGLDAFREVTGISAGLYHTCALLGSGRVACFGYNRYGQLGNGNTSNSSLPVSVAGIDAAVSVHAADRGDFTCAVLADSTVRCWGYNGYGNLGDGTTATRYTPVTVTGLNGVMQVSGGNIHACATRTDGTVWCWGYGGTGTLGNGSTANQYTPVQVNGVSGAVGVGAGYRFTCAVRGDGQRDCWGDNNYGQLGDATTTRRTSAVRVQ